MVPLGLIKFSILENFKQSYLYALKLVEKQNQYKAVQLLYQFGI